MPVEMSARQWSQFLADENYWPKGRFHDDHIVLLNGDPSGRPTMYPNDLEESDVVTVEYGEVRDSRDLKYVSDFVDYAREWLVKLTNTKITIQCPDDKVEQVMQAVLKAGGEVISLIKSIKPIPRED